MINRERKNRKKKGSSTLLLLLLLAILLFFGMNYFSTSSKIKVEAPFNLTKKFELPDGTLGVLNDGSSLNYNSDYTSGDIKISLLGEAFFEMKGEHAIEIETSHGTITSKGSNFNIRSWGHNFYLECYTGALSLSTNNSKTELTGGESINLVDGALQEIIKIRGDAPLWIEGILRFYEVPVRDVFDEVERQFNVEVISSVDDQPFSGTFHHFNLNDALKKICAPMNLKFEVQAKKVTIEQR